jgi:hypothetical protein
LNGLASKIMRGTYAPINSKYSQGLRDLISCMLKKEPGERPTLAQVRVCVGVWVGLGGCCCVWRGVWASMHVHTPWLF